MVSLNEITMHEKQRIHINTSVTVLMLMRRSIYQTILLKQQHSLPSDALTDPYLPKELCHQTGEPPDTRSIHLNDLDYITTILIFVYTCMSFI